MIDKDGKVYRGLQAQVAYLTEKVENGSSTPTGPTVDKITALDLATGEAALTYDANNGATIVKQGQISADGSTYDVAIEDKLPIVPGDNVTIGTTTDGKHLKISATGGGGGGVAGVSSFGGKTGAINVGKNLSMNGNVVNADFQPTAVVLDADANLGTLTTNQLATLQANTANPIVKRNEYYYLNDKQYTTDTLVYTHVAYENGKWYNKSITITISTKAWVKNVNEATTVNGKSGAVNLVAGSNVSITSSGNDITIAASGGGGGGSSDIQQTNGFYPYKEAVNYNPKVGTTYSYKDSNTDYYPSDCSYRQGQMIVDKRGVIYKVTATTMCECVYIPNRIMTIFSLVLPKNVTFPYSGTLTDEQKDLLSSVPDRAQVIDVQIAAENDLPDYNKHYLCSNDFINAQHGAYGSTYWAQYDDTKKMKVAFDYGTFTNKTYTISLVEAGGGNNVQQTNGFYQYNAAVTASPTVGNSYSYTNSQILYPSGCSYFYGQMIIDTNGAIYRVTSSTNCKCVYAPQGGGGGGGKIYQHNIYTLCDPATQVYWTGYTSDNTPLTSFAAWQAKFGTDKTYGGGYIVYNTSNYYPILYTQADSNSIKSYYISNSMSGSAPTATYEWGGTGNWTDVVKEV